MRRNERIESRRWIAWWLVLALLLTMTGINGSMVTGYAYTATSGVIKNGPVRVRTAPVDGEKITTFQDGTTVVVIDETTGSDNMLWYKVQFSYGQKKFEGYIRSDFVELSKEGASDGSTDVDSSQAGKTGTVTNVSGGVYVRSGAGTSYSIQTKVYKGQVLSILGQMAASDGRIWYNVSFSLSGVDYTGWICGDYVTINAASETPEMPETPENPETPTTPENPETPVETPENPEITVTDEEYIAALKGAGFPESYCTSLLALHKKYPLWQFVPVQTGLEWSDVVVNQNIPGKNLVHSSVNDARKSTDSAAYDWKTNKWYGYDGANWVCASVEYIAYCMDPRNFLDETYIFQFETLEYEPYQNAAGVKNILANTFMAGDYKDRDGVTRNYADTFTEIGTGLQVSPYHLASRCKQEQGAKGTSPLISGMYAGFEGYYNHFNINAYTTSSASSIVNGLAYSKLVGWDTIYKSISGGSAIVASRYVKRGQNTVYFEKFNVVNKDNLYSHQYMTNVMAAISEGSSIAKAYTDKNAAFVFRIPVYNNMPEKPAAFLDSGNPNNWLSSLTVSGGALTPGFQPEKTEYSLIVEESVDKITIDAAPVSGKSVVSGKGTYSINYGNNSININCISQSGVTRTYTINVVRQQPEMPEPEEPGQGTPDPEEPNPGTPENPNPGENVPGAGDIVVADGAFIHTDYKVGDVFSGIQPGTTAANLISGIKATNCTVKVLNADGSENTGAVGTGSKVAVYQSGVIVKQYEAVVYGDLNGDGKISNIDLVLLQKQILGLNSLSGAYLEAADAGKDGKVSNLDLVLLRKHILNLLQITQ